VNPCVAESPILVGRTWRQCLSQGAPETRTSQTRAAPVAVHDVRARGRKVGSAMKTCMTSTTLHALRGVWSHPCGFRADCRAGSLLALLVCLIDDGCGWMMPTKVCQGIYACRQLVVSVCAVCVCVCVCLSVLVLGAWCFGAASSWGT
jgi:hypothetical protein